MQTDYRESWPNAITLNGALIPQSGTSEICFLDADDHAWAVFFKCLLTYFSGFGSPLEALRAMAQNWGTDYRCGCCDCAVDPGLGPGVRPGNLGG